MVEKNELFRIKGIQTFQNIAVILGDWGGAKMFFPILAINMQNQKKCSKEKKFLFLFRTL